ncbi:large subunit ribosomal protein L31e [Nematocida sp. ERTm5]|nr:large subunit ribosomal protein L31e [Nematocida sp. AWRm79]KAI5184215.1 large subunit ribosomal protein L31e [Nematocida sp. AWRm78]OAG30025.1 large subunit ribosomal protein L31e [Nematocida sp. ERTm5]
MANITSENKVIVLTVNLWKLVKGCSQKRWADCAVRNLKRLIKKQFRTDMDVKIDMDLNKAIWARGKKNLPTRIRVEIGKRPSFKDNAKTEMFVKHVHVPEFKGLQTESFVAQVDQ